LSFFSCTLVVIWIHFLNIMLIIVQLQNVYHVENMCFNEIMMIAVCTKPIQRVGFLQIAHWNKSMSRHIAPLGYSILTPSQPFLVLLNWFGFMVFNVTFNNISVISRRSILLVEETGVLGGKPPTCCKSLTKFIT